MSRTRQLNSAAPLASVSDDEEDAPFIESGSSKPERSTTAGTSLRHRQDHGSFFTTFRRRAVWWPLLIHALVLALYVVPTVWWSLSRRGAEDGLPYSPANQVLEYEYRRTPPYQVDNPFAGEPRPELDQAWHDLLEGTFVGVSASDFAKVNATSVPIDGTDTYLAQLGVFHELHCLKKIKQFVNWEYYHPNSTKEEYAVQAEHMDHCIEKLRMEIVCRGNTALIPFQLRPVGPGGSTLPAQWYHTKEKCVKWEPLQQWAREHAVPKDKLPI